MGGKNMTRCEDKLGVRPELAARVKAMRKDHASLTMNRILPYQPIRVAFFAHCTGRALRHGVHTYVFCSFGLYLLLNCMTAD